MRLKKKLNKKRILSFRRVKLKRKYSIKNDLKNELGQLVN